MFSPVAVVRVKVEMFVRALPEYERVKAPVVVSAKLLIVLVAPLLAIERLLAPSVSVPLILKPAEPAAELIDVRLVKLLLVGTLFEPTCIIPVPLRFRVPRPESDIAYTFVKAVPVLSIVRVDAESVKVPIEVAYAASTVRVCVDAELALEMVPIRLPEIVAELLFVMVRPLVETLSVFTVVATVPSNSREFRLVSESALMELAYEVLLIARDP